MAVEAHKALGRTCLESVDLAVVGGGALGCAVAWEGASRGLKVALLEQDDFGCGASANSLKVVHGGLRYLQRMDIGRARASAAERSTFLRIAPHLVEPLPCAMPTRRSLLRGRLAMACGLALNAVLTADRNRGLLPERYLRAGGLMSRDALAAAAPGLRIDDATGAARWYDARMLDSERLVLSLALAAGERGALLMNHHRVTRLCEADGKVAGIEAVDVLTGTEVQLGARLVVDCRSGWASRAAPFPGPPSVPGFIRAVNLVLPDAGLEVAVGFPMRDDRGRAMPGRMLFAAPWNGVTLVGTWYSRQDSGPPGSLARAEIETMVKLTNASYGDWNWTIDDVRCVHIGFMPEMAGSAHVGGEPVAADRPICEPAAASGGPAGLWYLQTEKWTTVRRLAQRFVDEASAAGAWRVNESRSAELPLPGGDHAGIASAERELAAIDFPTPVARHLRAAYGSRVTMLLALIRVRPELGRELPNSNGVIAAEILHAITSEHARTLGDLVRRTGVGAAGRPAKETLAAMASLAADELGWSAEAQRAQIAAVMEWPIYPLPSQASAA